MAEQGNQMLQQILILCNMLLTCVALHQHVQACRNLMCVWRMCRCVRTDGRQKNRRFSSQALDSQAPNESGVFTFQFAASAELNI